NQDKVPSSRLGSYGLLAWCCVWCCWHNPPVWGTPLPPSSIPELPMDMAPDAFDDRYEGCERRMELELPELNRTEFSTNSVYAEGWSRAARAWQQSRVPQPPGGLCNRAFNAAVRQAGRSGHRYRHTFPFKALHFLLSQALSTLQSTQRRCHRALRGRVRFGHFTSASLNNGSGFICGTFGCDTLFTVHTCWGALIRDFSLYSMEEEILIPPSEVFQVTSAVLTGHRSLIQLQSQGINSTYNCELLRGVGLRVSHGCQQPHSIQGTGVGDQHPQTQEQGPEG
uniref:NAD(P)(+)--arginine ADP-ribosyltransferase n=1 Tax=Melopsittacus undulatus TaxID=13146 RepID=A0A8V5GPL1_MELUD